VPPPAQSEVAELLSLRGILGQRSLAEGGAVGTGLGRAVASPPLRQIKTKAYPASSSVSKAALRPNPRST
jgi:hypothetical protein